MNKRNAVAKAILRLYKAGLTVDEVSVIQTMLRPHVADSGVAKALDRIELTLAEETHPARRDYGFRLASDVLYESAYTISR